MRPSRRKITNRARGLSFVEILAALAIVIAIAAVAVPWTFGWLGGRELDNAEDQLAMQLVMARAAAREEGRPVEVVATSASGRSTIRARWMEELLPDGGAARSEESDRPQRADAGDADDDAIAANWADMDLPEGIELWLEDEVPGEDPGTDLDGGLADAADPAERAEAEADAAIDAMDDDGFARPAQVLAIFLPDGTAIVAPVLMLRTDAGVRRSLLIDRATGRPRAADEPRPQPGAPVRPDFDMPADAGQ